MNVSGVRLGEGFYQYNSTKISELRNRQIETEAQAQAQKISKAQEPAESKPQKEALQERDLSAQKQEFGAFDYAQQYRPGEVYQHNGEDSSLEKLDVEQAITDLDKDRVLRQYQFFVGTDKDAQAVQSSKDIQPSVRAVENFML